MSWVKQRYRDISPVTLQVVGGAVSSSLYCGEVEGVAAGLAESFLVELYRCKLCRFTCSLKTSIGSHLLLTHRPAYLEGGDGGGRAEGGDEAGLQRGVSPYRLDLTEESKQSDEDEDFLLYNMLDNMSPPTCDISTEGGLQVAHTCEVSTLFEEEEQEEAGAESIFPLKAGSVDLSCPMAPPPSQEETAQSAHLMTLGLCRISTIRPPAAPPTSSPPVLLPPDDSLHLKGEGPRSLPCLLCPLTLPSRRLLDVHVRSHLASGGFGCVVCSWTADSWAELELHWRRRHGRRRRKRKREKQEHTVLSQRTLRKEPSQSARQQTHRWRGRPIGRSEGKKAEPSDRQPAASRSESRMCVLVPSQTSGCQIGSSQDATKRTTRRMKTKEASAETGLSCSLCHRKFCSKLTLRRHLGVHGGQKPFTCPHCPYSSRLKGSLLQHLRTHTGEKPYRCAECPYASIDRSSLLRHIRTHSQEKPYSCQLCDYSSIQKKSLDLHARRHHTGEAFPCQQCEYSSPDRQLLLRHVRRHHTSSQHAVL